MIGAGRMAHVHVNHIRTVDPTAQIVAVFSRTEEHAQAAAAEWGAPTHYTDYTQLLERETPDAVYICTPTYTHAEIGLACAARDLPMFVEKPLDLNLATAQALVDEVERRGLIHVVAFHWRYTPIYRKALELIGDDPVSLVNLRWYWTRPPIPWMWQRTMAGGQIVDQNIHLVDASRGLAGEITSVYAAYNDHQVNFEREFDNWDGYAITFRYAGGAVGNCAGTYGLYPEIQIGPVADFALRDRLVRLTPKAVTLYTPDGMQSWELREPFHLGVNRAFIHAVQSGDGSALVTSMRSGMGSTAATLAANRSAATGDVVDMANFLAEATRA